MPTPCAFSYQSQHGFCLCRCRTFSIWSCPSREDALAKWESQHMHQTTSEEVHHAG